MVVSFSHRQMGWFESFRDDGSNTLYRDARYPAATDVTTVIIIIACVIVAIALIIIVLGTRATRRWHTLLHILLMLHSGIVIIVTLFGQGWLQSETTTRTDYCEFLSPHQYEMDAHIGIHVGLRSVNVSLTGNVQLKDDEGNAEYNERFWFIRAGHLVKEFQSALDRGLPQPIIYVLEYFSIDRGDVRWGRIIQGAGYIVYILLWASFPCWVIGNIIVCIVVLHGLLFMLLTGTLMVTSCILYITLLPKTFVIRMDESSLKLELGWCYWLCLASGLITLITSFLALLIYKLEHTVVERIFLTESQQWAKHSIVDEDYDGGWEKLKDNVVERMRRVSTVSLMMTSPVQSSMVFDNEAFDEEKDPSDNQLPPTSCSPLTRHVAAVENEVKLIKKTRPLRVYGEIEEASSSTQSMADS